MRVCGRVLVCLRGDQYDSVISHKAVPVAYEKGYSGGRYC
ncbi:hypothetical protein JCM19237_1653 [Photobacterium aphoticum]|uniref:Uncharacterized protein n=1 Tax=Photobacterium aphoticum TaxID=754436 RepID=A0A090QUW0_9GAMM|nr:hypothetical protein JCM19237_1653 [Photobacterium aphoticum]